MVLFSLKKEKNSDTCYDMMNLQNKMLSEISQKERTNTA